MKDKGRCKTCRFYDAVDRTDTKLSAEGECRKNPPVVFKNGTSRWPEVHAAFWCGAYESIKAEERR